MMTIELTDSMVLIVLLELKLLKLILLLLNNLYLEQCPNHTHSYQTS